MDITTVILAGGRGVRIGGNKGLQLLDDKPLTGWVINSVRKHSHAIVINANEQQQNYSALGYPVLADLMPDWPGPLAGLQAAMAGAITPLVASVPCDTPFLPENLLLMLKQSMSGPDIEAVVAVADGQRQPAIALYRRQVLPKLEDFLRGGGRKVNDWLDSLQLMEVVFDNASQFSNINTPEELQRAENLIRQKKV